ncbi:MAG: hypothetical protein WBE80_15920 [Methylocella sp.]
MSAVKERAGRHRDGTGALAALPALITTVAAHVPPDVLALTIWAHRLPMPSHLFKVVNRLFAGLEGLKEIRAFMDPPFRSIRYRSKIADYIKSKTAIPFFLSACYRTVSRQADVYSVAVRSRS